MAKPKGLQAERVAIEEERRKLVEREKKLRLAEEKALAEIVVKSPVGKQPVERVEAFFASIAKLGFDEAEKRLKAS